jgi:hypothetical protein
MTCQKIRSGFTESASALPRPNPARVSDFFSALNPMHATGCIIRFQIEEDPVHFLENLRKKCNLQPEYGFVF